MAYSKQLQRFFREYELEGNPMPADLNDVAEWAMRTGRWQAPPELARKKLVEDLGRALREEYFEDDQGNRVRAKHPAVVRRGGAQYSLWQDARTATHEHMTSAFAVRRNGVVGDLKQLKTDADWYNRCRDGHPPVQVVLDFTQDIAEIEAVSAKRRELAAKRRSRANSDAADRAA
jgi:hypothetical protein